MLSKLLADMPALQSASADAKLEFVRTSATNYRMDLVHTPDRPLYGEGARRDPVQAMVDDQRRLTEDQSGENGPQEQEPLPF